MKSQGTMGEIILTRNKIEDIQKAWENLAHDGILYQGEHEKSTNRSFFVLILISQLDFVEVNEKPRPSIKIKLI